MGLTFAVFRIPRVDLWFYGGCRVVIPANLESVLRLGFQAWVYILV